MSQESARRKGLTSGSLIKVLFESESPETFVKTLPSQSLYLALKSQGLASSAELVEMATLEQCKVLLDLDLWDGDRIHEDNIWEWLSLTDANEGISLLQKIVKCIDLKIIGRLISKYTEIVTFEEPTDSPPKDSYTPDKGLTWIKLTAPDGDKDFALGRLLALIFETNADIFYQIIAVPSVATDSALEEEAFEDKSRRLLSEGIPDSMSAAQLNAPMPIDVAVAKIGKSETRPAIEDIQVVEPLLYEGIVLQPLGSLLDQITPKSGFECELTMLMNAAITFWNINHCEADEVMELTSKVRGAINIGLELLLEESKVDALEIYQKIGIGGLYRTGLAQLFEIRRLACSISDDQARALVDDTTVLAVLAGAREPFPEVPIFFTTTGPKSSKGEVLEGGYKPIEKLEMFRVLKSFLSERVG